MNALMLRFATFLLALCLTASAWAGDALQIKLKDGSNWRGRVNDAVDIAFVENGVTVSMNGKITKAGDDYVTVEGAIGGVSRTRTIFKTDIVSIKSTGTGAAVDVPSATPANSTETSTGTGIASASSATVKPADSNKKPLGVFVLPLEGMVG